MDVPKRLEGMRLTPLEQKEALLYLMDMVEPTQEESKSVQLVTIAETVETALEQVVQGDEIKGLTTGYQTIDAFMRGMIPGAITVVFGKTGHGKSQLTQNITMNLALKGIPTLFIGLEMTNDENTVRFMQMLKDKTGEKIQGLPIVYPPDEGIGYMDLEPIIKEAIEFSDVKLVVIDHLHMFRTDARKSTADGIEDICRELKRIAKAHHVHLMVVSHISRTLNNGVPDLEDLKGSSGIEQIADIALAVWRDPDGDDTQLKVVQRKNRRSRKQGETTLSIINDVRLMETVIMDPFPSGLPKQVELV